MGWFATKYRGSETSGPEINQCLFLEICKEPLALKLVTLSGLWQDVGVTSVTSTVWWNRIQ